MSDSSQELKYNQSTDLGEVEAINYLKQAIASGKNWYLALLEAIGLWTIAKEVSHYFP